MDENTVIEAAAELRRQYYRKWRATHKEAVKRHNRAYWMRKAEKAAEQRKEANLGNNGKTSA